MADSVAQFDCKGNSRKSGMSIQRVTDAQSGKGAFRAATPLDMCCDRGFGRDTIDPLNPLQQAVG